MKIYVRVCACFWRKEINFLENNVMQLGEGVKGRVDLRLKNVDRRPQNNIGYAILKTNCG